MTTVEQHAHHAFLQIAREYPSMFLDSQRVFVERHIRDAIADAIDEHKCGHQLAKEYAESLEVPQ